ncbi:MAG: serine/threonine protein kinase, partial [Phycisphaerae bacterium]|nr:serine/threonine protein kinase [Phycisphaerae bacterium]
MTNQFSITQPLNPDPLNRGDRLGDIMLLELIGQGGEGQIWSGVDGRRQRIVAVKVIDVLEQATSKLAKVSLQFERQVHLVASIDHPNVLPLYHLGTFGSRFYFVMRYTPLGSLADLLEKGPLSLDETLYFSAQIALTLEHLHKKGVVHRDLKPSNILFGPERQIYLADFGLAKRLSNETMALHTGRGTGPYAPYEQHTMAQLTPQTDIYSLGIVIYEMLVGRLPWDGTTNLATRQFQDRVELPDIHQLDDELPLAITQALREMTAFDWQQRPATASEALQLFVTAVDGIGQKQFVNLYSAPPVMEEDLLEAGTAQELWQKLREQGSNPLFIPLTYLALLDSAYSKEDV